MNIDAIRNDTPGTRLIKHFNNAGCSLHPKPVIDAVTQFLEEESMLGGYEIAALREKEILDFYVAAAEMLNCKSTNIAFVNSATDGFAKAISSIHFKQGDVILTTLNDYASNQIQFLSLKKRFGVNILRAENKPSGEVDPDVILQLIKKHRPVLVSVTHVPNNTGMIQPINAIGEICAAEDILYAVDACQSAGQIPLDVQQIKCDFLTFTMRKFMRGPRGSGVLYVSDKMLNRNMEPLFIDMRGADWVSENNYQQIADATRFEFIEQSYAVLIGATVAIRYYLNLGQENVYTRNKEISAYTRLKLSSIPGIQLMDQGIQLSNIISAISAKKNIFEIKAALNRLGINIGAAQKKFALLDFEQKHIEGTLRISPHYYNTQEEIDILADSIHSLNP